MDFEHEFEDGNVSFDEDAGVTVEIKDDEFSAEISMIDFRKGNPDQKKIFDAAEAEVIKLFGTKDKPSDCAVLFGSRIK